MNLDFLGVLSQPNQKHGEQVGTTRTGGIHANLNVPGTSPPNGNSGNKIPAPTVKAETRSHTFPVCSQSMGTERANVDEAVPVVPGVPTENGQFSNAETGVLAEQETAKKQLLRWIGARCPCSQDVWGSEKSLYHDYRHWCRKYSRAACSNELFCVILDELFQRELDGWQGLCVAADWCLSRGNTGNRSDARHLGSRRLQ
jgi:hypothetical protein